MNIKNDQLVEQSPRSAPDFSTRSQMQQNKIEMWNERGLTVCNIDGENTAGYTVA